MTDYTPTTEEVKNWYVVGKNELEAAPYLYSEQEFDRWLESVKKEAIQDYLDREGLE
jgi:hypothetical protein